MILSVGGLLGFVVMVVIVGLVFWLLTWLLDYTEVPQPFNKVAKVILAVLAVLIVINWLLGFTGTPVLRFR